MHQFEGVQDTEYGSQISLKIVNVKHCAKSNLSLKDLINTRIKDKKLFYCIEVSSKDGFILDYSDFCPLPLFTSITNICSPSRNHDNIWESPTFQMLKQITTTPVVAHVTCASIKKNDVEFIGKNNLCNNFFIIKGDGHGTASHLYAYASELLSALRDSNKMLTLGVAAHPHLILGKNSQEELYYLKKKVNESGADFIITQIFFSAQSFIEFLKNCRANSITIPIIPGIYIPSTFTQFQNMLKITQIEIQNEILKKFVVRQYNEEEFYNFSFNYVKNMMKEIMNNPFEPVFGFQFFTLNKVKPVLEMIRHFNF